MAKSIHLFLLIVNYTSKKSKNKKGGNKMISRKLKYSVLTMGIVFSMFASFAYATYSTYNVTLPKLKGDVTLRQGSKATGEDYIEHKDILIGPSVNGQAMAVWIDKYDNGWDAVCDYALHYEGQGPYTLYADPVLNSGDTIRVRADNKDLTAYSYGATGSIDLK